MRVVEIYHMLGEIAPDLAGALGVDTVSLHILNPVQCSAKGMDARTLKPRFGDRLVFWGGGVDTQRTLPFGTSQEVRDQVRERIETFAPGGGFVFCPIHNVQANVPVENVLAMFEVVGEYRRSGSQGLGGDSGAGTGHQRERRDV